ncbi:MAG TPA: CinA family nicotinamide mononucleotide deamidase-related protein [Spirochaetota bacterium]|nr:CinA family nicotinamide mononucleotide deamidase-related protein [Spirochaetota bacterium]HPS85389.1 CinA family nicotinamide mononucleotide deamidase-related protein [Spirochaetota bacterium]
MPAVIIISTGDELLYGTTLNTNSTFISSLFFGSNFKVIKHVTVGDDINSIVTSISESIDEADVIITTGGLGPTDDDNTVEAVCRVFKTNIVTDEESDKKTMDYFKSMNFSLNKLDSKMSTVPENSYVIKNKYGLAPGFVMESDGKIVISLPGVPAETEDMMVQRVIPYLKDKYSFHENMKLAYRMSGIRESDINTMVNEISLPDYLRIGITSKSGICDLIITGMSENLTEKDNIDSLIKSKFIKYILNYDAVSPEQELVFLLRDKGLTISTAESCTGGLIAKRITDIAGSSEVYKGSVVAYSNEIKTEFLGVSDDTLRIHGAVSENTAAEMAASVKKKFKTDVSISTTGIAGPGGGSDSKPVGTVCFGFAINEYRHTFTKQIRGNRDRIRTFSSLYAINFLRDYLKNLN